MKRVMLLHLTLTSFIALGQDIEITLKNGGSKELAGKSQRERIIKNHEQDSKIIFSQRT